MTKYLYPFLCVFALASQEGHAQNAAPKASCEALIDACRDISVSLNVNNANPDECQECISKCSKAKELCFKETNDKGLESASASHMNCANICKGLLSK